MGSHVAKVTNRLSIVALGIVGTVSFYRQGLIDLRKSLPIAFIMALGTVVGSLVVVGVDELVLDLIVGPGLFLILGLLLFRPECWISGKEGETKSLDWGQVVAYFCAGVYAGLIVLGVGFFMLAALIMLTGYDLGRANALKVLLLLIVGLQSLLIFGETGEVN